ncbi:MAG: hypothetical protein KGL52_16345 [Rhodospirillales bacterium]|jgi:hypothetical protein|nr:hypothetical protein [Rhodospirillales bacterium]
MDFETGDIVVGLMVAALGLLGLFLAARAWDDEMYLFGLALAGFAVLFDFGVVRRHFDRKDAALAARRAGHE